MRLLYSILFAFTFSAQVANASSCGPLATGTSKPVSKRSSEKPVLGPADLRILQKLSKFGYPQLPMFEPEILNYFNRRQGRVHPQIVLAAITKYYNYSDPYIVHNHPLVLPEALKVIEQIQESLFSVRYVKEDFKEGYAFEVNRLIQNNRLPLPLGLWTKLMKHFKTFFMGEAYANYIVYGTNIYLRQLNQNPIYNSLSSYLKFKLIKESLKRDLDLPYEQISDILISTGNAEKIDVYLYGTEPTSGVQKNSFGFFFEKIETMSNPKQDVVKNYQWQSGSTSKKMEVKIRPLGQFALAPTPAPAPNYTAMILDGNLGGTVLISKNMDEFAKELAGYYRDHFISEGFKMVDSKVIGFKSAEALLIESVRSMETDYLLKEGHSESQSNAVINLSSRVRIERFTRKKQNGFTESVMVFSAVGGTDEFVAQESLAQALRQRKRPTQQFLYFDTSCFSQNSLCYLTKNVATIGFTPIGSTGLVDTFTGEGDNPITQILRGLRSRQSYAKINQNIEKYAGPTGYVFPNDSNYLRDEELRQVSSRFLTEIKRLK